MKNFFNMRATRPLGIFANTEKNNVKTKKKFLEH
jgi:hypothetical protein